MTPEGRLAWREKMKKHYETGRLPWNKGKKCPEISGENHPMWGKHHSYESRKKTSRTKIGIPNKVFLKNGKYAGDRIGFSPFWKDEVRLMFGNSCVLCMGYESNKKLSVHHVDGERINHRINNLVIFCNKCHQIVHNDEEFWNGTSYLEKQGVIANGPHGKE